MQDPDRGSTAGDAEVDDKELTREEHVPDDPIGVVAAQTDDARLDELSQKRWDTGLTDAEADELGRLVAETEGREYVSHDQLAGESEDQPAAWDEAAKEQEEAGAQTLEGHAPEEERAVGTERQPIPAAGSGYAPPKGSEEVPPDDPVEPIGR